MTPTAKDKLSKSERQATLHDLLQERMRLAIRHTFITILEEEVEGFIQAALYQRTPKRRDYRNGSYERNLITTVGELEELPVPRTRNGFRTELFERYQRRQTELDELIGEMFIQSVSTLQVGNLLEALTGTHPIPSTVSRVFHLLEGEFETWKSRWTSQAHYLYVFADGTYFTVIYDQEVCKMPILAVIGIDTEGQRDILAFTVGAWDNQAAWEALMDDLKKKGLSQVNLWITDGNQAMINAIETKFPTSQRQRCVKHKMVNVLTYIPEKQQALVEPELKALVYQTSRAKADQEVAAFVLKYQPVYPTAIACLQRDLEACLTFYRFPEKHWKFICTINCIERLFGEVKAMQASTRSHKMAAAFRN